MAKALRGFSNLSYFPITTNTAAAYTPSTKKALGIGARSLTKEDTRSEFKIPGDNGIYMQGSDFESTKLTIQVNEMDLATLAALTGAVYETTGDMPDELLEGELDTAPAVALSFAGLMSDGSHRMYQYFCCNLVTYKADLKARLDTGNEVNGYTLEFLCSGRLVDQIVRSTKDSALPVGSAAADISWLNTIPPALPKLTGAVLSGTVKVDVATGALALTYSGTPAEAPTLAYKWQTCATESGTYADVSGATSAVITPVVGDVGKFLHCVVTASGSASGTVITNAIVIEAAA